MAILQSCCFWKDVRKGSYATAIYTLLYFTFSSCVMLLYVNDEQEFLAGQRNHPVGESILARGNITTATVIFNIMFLVCSICLVLASVLVMVGLKNNRRELLVPWIFFMLCDVLIECCHLLHLIAVQSVVFDPVVGFLFTIDFFIKCLNLYCLLCVISQYQEYRQGNGFEQPHTKAQVVVNVTANESQPPRATATKVGGHRHFVSSPYISSFQQSNISSIPEETDAQHSHPEATNKDEAAPDAPDGTEDDNDNVLTVNVFRANSTEHHLVVPVISLDPRSN